MKRSMAFATLMMLALPLWSSVKGQTTTVRPRPRPTTIYTRIGTDSAARPIDRGITTLAPGVAPTLTRQPPPPPPPSPAINARTAISRSRMESVLGGSSAGIRVVRASGVVERPKPTDSVSVAPGEFIFRKMSDTARRVAAGELRPIGLPTGTSEAATYSLPYRLITLDSAGNEHILIPFFSVNGGGLSWDVRKRSYSGTARVGVVDTLNPNRTDTLLQKFLIQLTTTSQGSVDPPDLPIDHTGLKYASVTIDAYDSTYVRIQTSADLKGIFVPVSVYVMKGNMVPLQRSIEGFGLATTEITVTLPPGMTGAEKTTLSFSASGPPVRPSPAELTGAAAYTVRLRSGLPGPDTIEAFLDGKPIGYTIVTSKTPWTFLGATLIGIIFGGLARFLGAKRRKRANALLWDIVKGIPFGVLAAAASAIGLDLLQFKIDDPGAWVSIMVTAMVGAWLGARILDRLVPGEPDAATH